MATVSVVGEKSFEVASGTKLVLGIEDAGIDILHRCGGQARCTTCRVRFVSGEPDTMTAEERELLEEDGLLGKYRLSCQIHTTESAMTVEVVNRAHEKGITPGDRPED